MRITLVIAAIALSLVSCKEAEKSTNNDLAEVQEVQESYESFGKKFSGDAALNASEMLEKYRALETGDTINISFSTRVMSVCKEKGCWMVLDLPETDQDPMVKFKDYGFFVPKDIEGKEVVVNGKAFAEVTSVEDQKHYAKDAGESEEEIAAITEPEQSFGFLADGVLLKK